ncbi:MAG: iron-sulfur cluster assembly protein [Terracidiphilus sp.]
MPSYRENDQTAAPIAGPFREEMILQQLKTVRDPEIPVDIVNLGLVYAAASSQIDAGGRRIDVRMSLTAPGCSMSDVIKAEVEQKLAALPEVREVRVEIVFDPPWNPGMMSEGARLHLGFDSDYGTPNSTSAPSSSGPFKVIR